MNYLMQEVGEEEELQPRQRKDLGQINVTFSRKSHLSKDGGRLSAKKSSSRQALQQIDAFPAMTDLPNTPPECGLARTDVPDRLQPFD
jgi:hypothetical protein